MELLDTNIVSHYKKINFKKEISKFLKYWPWIIACAFVFYLAGYFYLKYKQPQYQTKTTLLFQESNSGKGALSDLKSLGMGISSDNELQGQAAIIVSKPILKKVGKSLNLDVSFYAKGKIREIELYNLSPYKGQILYSLDNFNGASYYIEPVDQASYKLTEGPIVNGKNVFKYGEVAQLPWGNIVITKNEKGYKPYKNFLVFTSINNVVKQLESSISVQMPSGLLMHLSTVGPIPKKSEDILNELSRQYKIDAINDKNIEAENTQNFIDDRLDLISVDLEKIELNKENFKKANKITDLDVQTNIAVGRLSKNVEVVFNQSSQIEILNLLYEMASSGKEQLFPTGLGLSSSTEGLLNRYNELLLTKKRTLKQATAINPSIKAFDKELSELLISIRKNIQESRALSQKLLGQTNVEIGEDKASIYKYPSQERTFRNIERQRNLKESLYLYLLQKREENAITLAVATAKAKVVNPAYTIGVVDPNYTQVKVASVAIGLLLPILIIFVFNILDTKIRTKDDLENISTTPVIAEIPSQDYNNPQISNNDFTIFAESFRILISNVKYLVRSKGITKGATILVTSSVKGEGKTTVSLNTALSLAGSGKVLLIGADIRNPQLLRYLKQTKNKKTKGLTEYLISADHISSYIFGSGILDNLDILLSGATPPNPSDLLDMPKFDEMIEKLKETYDYIVMDSAPIMLVSDSLHLVDISDLVIYTVKSGFSEEEMIDFANNFRRDNEVANMVFVLNNVKPEYSKYGYKYGYGYYSSSKPKNIWSKLLTPRSNSSQEN